MTYSVEVVEHSVALGGDDIATMLLRYPRCIHSEFMTHRVFSRNASSSRAIPVERLIQDVMDDPFIPSHWLANQPGMQGGAEHDVGVTIHFGQGYKSTCNKTEAWLWARDRAVEQARYFAKAGYHKQIVNRLLEPFAHIRVVVTATEWDNFFELRDHKDAEPHIRDLAVMMKEALAKSTPNVLIGGKPHLPFIRDHERDNPNAEYISAARCARTSYLLHDGKETTLEADTALCFKLMAAKPGHLSPFEHQAWPDPEGKHKDKWGNFRYWVQWRKALEQSGEL